MNPEQSARAAVAMAGETVTPRKVATLSPPPAELPLDEQLAQMTAQRNRWVINSMEAAREVERLRRELKELEERLARLSLPRRLLLALFGRLIGRMGGLGRDR